MAVFVVLYRGINVVGKNTVRMESLREMHTRLGHQKVRSYIQSGNIVLSANGSAGAIARSTSAEFVEKFGFAAKVVVLGAKQWGQIMEQNPYAKYAVQNPRTVHAGICDGQPDAKGLKALFARTRGSESFTIGKGIIYLHAPDGFATSKFAAGMEKASGVYVTVRNWRTMEALWKMTGAAA